ncbi:MAG: haloacid dehalogenase-like hydrolase [Chloroflexi bacterium]|nr:MAG: haloacid dehalogenase-like hydrolase [Chloroflexota bacterium]
MPRILDLDRDALAELRGRALHDAVVAAEGRTLVSEVIAGAQSLANGVHNMEIAAAVGADILILNFIETVQGDDGWTFPDLGPVADLRTLARRVGRPIGVNLEPGDVPGPRRATTATARRLIDDGAAMLCLTANPGTETGYAELARVTADLRDALGPDAAIWSGKMHQAGRVDAIDGAALVRLVEAGADGVLLPLPGTVPGVTREIATAACVAVHEAGALVMGTIGTSQEGARPSIAQALALTAKEVGVDAHHIGDAGLGRTGDPDVLYEYSIAIRGRRHTWRRMALGNRRP